MHSFDLPYLYDCVTNAGLRSLHVVPEQSSLWASIVKYFVPTTTIKTMIQNLSVVLGARYYMREEHEFGTFQSGSCARTPQLSVSSMEARWVNLNVVDASVQTSRPPGAACAAIGVPVASPDLR